VFFFQNKENRLMNELVNKEKFREDFIRAGLALMPYDGAD
jgi:hypothetical protein